MSCNGSGIVSVCYFKHIFHVLGKSLCNNICRMILNKLDGIFCYSLPIIHPYVCMYVFRMQFLHCLLHSRLCNHLDSDILNHFTSIQFNATMHNAFGEKSQVLKKGRLSALLKRFPKKYGNYHLGLTDILCRGSMWVILPSVLSSVTEMPLYCQM